MTSKILLETPPLFNAFPVWELEVNDSTFSREALEQPHLWEDNSLVNQRTIGYSSERKEYIPGTYPELDEWFDEFKKNNDILDIVATHFENDETNANYFFRQYPIEDKGIDIREFIYRRCSFFFRIIKDEPGFSMRAHFDNNAVVGNIFFNLVDNDNVSTEFFNTFTTFHKEVLDEETNLMYVAPTEAGRGVFFLNSSHLYHNITNRTNKSRFVINAVVFVPQLTNLLS